MRSRLERLLDDACPYTPGEGHRWSECNDLPMGHRDGPCSLGEQSRHLHHGGEL